MKAFSTRVIPEAGRKLLQQAGVELIEWGAPRDLTSKELIEHCLQAEALLAVGRTKIDREFLNVCKHLKVISLFSVGYDNVDISAANEFKIPIGHTPDVLSKATADVAFLLMQATARKAFYHHRRILNGNWDFFDPQKDLGTDLQGKTLGIFGLGNIGFEMAKSAKGAFEMDIIYHNRHSNPIAEKQLGAKLVSFEELLSKSDVISVHANLSDETKGIFDKGAFEKMKPAAIFINTARGAMHNEHELLTALKEKTIWGAGLDVTNPEPMQKHNALLEMANVCVLPHIGSATKQTRDAMAILAAKNLIAGIKGEKLPKIVNLEIYN